MVFHERLTALRKAKGYNQKQCAAVLGIDISKYNKWEGGVNNPNFETLSMLADFFHTTTDYLLGRTDDSYRPECVDATDWENRLIAQVTNALNSFFLKLNEYKKAEDAFNLDNVFAHAILGGIQTVLEAHTKLLFCLQHLGKLETIAYVEELITDYLKAIGNIRVGGYRDANGVYVDGVSTSTIELALRGALEDVLPKYKEYRQKVVEVSLLKNTEISGG